MGIRLSLHSTGPLSQTPPPRHVVPALLRSTRQTGLPWPRGSLCDKRRTFRRVRPSDPEGARIRGRIQSRCEPQFIRASVCACSTRTTSVPVSPGSVSLPGLQIPDSSPGTPLRLGDRALALLAPKWRARALVAIRQRARLAGSVSSSTRVSARQACSAATQSARHVFQAPRYVIVAEPVGAGAVGAGAVALFTAARFAHPISGPTASLPSADRRDDQVPPGVGFDSVRAPSIFSMSRWIRRRSMPSTSTFFTSSDLPLP